MKDDSRKVIEGDTYISLTNNEDYILDAISKGASKVICESGLYSVDTLIVKDTRKYLKEYLDNFYKEKFKKIKIIGVTGTNGKTTTCYLAWQIFNKLGYKSSYIGTIGFYIDAKIKDLENTTPDILDIYNMINESIDSGCSYIFMEVSSQALSYGRLGDLKFDYAIFTNLTNEHLDYHKTMENYALAKQKLFNQANIRIINYDSDYKDYFITPESITYGFNGGDYYIEEYSVGDITKFKINGKIYKTNLIGKYNIYNLLISIILLDKENIEYDIKTFEKLDFPKGRMDVIEYRDNKIIVDYAHTPDAIKNVLNAAKELDHGSIITIIGAGGNRDKSKRPLMGCIATELSDYVIFTDDNPREENELSIIDDIIQNVDTSNYEIITNRQKAIIKGIQMLNKFDILLVLGKGHEDYQIIGNKKIHFSDHEVIMNYIRE